jgi:hypothetical protein
MQNRPHVFVRNKYSSNCSSPVFFNKIFQESYDFAATVIQRARSFVGLSETPNYDSCWLVKELLTPKSHKLVLNIVQRQPLTGKQ